MKIAVSFLKSKYNLIETIDKINNTDVEFIHVDIMDGDFVPNKSFTYEDVNNVLKTINKKLDIHLMVANPLDYIIKFKNLKPEYITIHSEIDKNINDLIYLIKSYGIKVGIAINPKTSTKCIEKYLSIIDNVLIMSVEPGMGGQKFMNSILYKIDVLDKLRKENNYNYLISIDGGINDDTIKYVKNVDYVVSGSYICMSDDYQKQINSLRME